MAEIAEQYNEAHSSYDSSEMIHVQSETGCQGKIDSKPKDGGFIKRRYCYFCQSPSVF